MLYAGRKTQGIPPVLDAEHELMREFPNILFVKWSETC